MTQDSRALFEALCQTALRLSEQSRKKKDERQFLEAIDLASNSIRHISEATSLNLGLDPVRLQVITHSLQLSPIFALVVRQTDREIA